MQFCTVVARNYLAYARVLATSVAKHHPGQRLVVLVLDDDDHEIDEAHEPFDVMRPSELDLEPHEFSRMATIYDVLELATAVKPWLMARLLERDATACYLDPDISVFGPLDDLGDLAEESTIVLTPHTTSPMPRDGLIPGEREIMLAGVYNLGFLALSRDADGFLAWWSERLRRDCRNAQGDALFVDQRWVDLVPGYFEHAIYTDPGANVAYWNLSARRVKRSGSGYEVNGRPLRFFHFSGFDPLRPHLLSKHQVGELRIRLEDNPAVATLCQSYANALLDSRYLEASQAPYRYDFTADGVRIDPRMRRLYRQQLIADERDGRPSSIPDPFDPAQSQAFLRWVARPLASSGPGRIPRYLRAVYDERADLQTHFGELVGANADRFMDWVARHGRTQAGIPAECAPMWALPPIPRAAGRTRDGVNVVGYLEAENGVGEVARMVIDTLRAARMPFSAVSCRETASRQSAAQDLSDAVSEPCDMNVVCVNADELPMLGERLGERLPRARHTVGFWAWEVEAFPAWMAESARLVDEIWVYSAHAANAIAPMVDVPVRVFAPPIPTPAPSDAMTRAELGLPGGFLVLFCFDFHSVAERKNPMAVVDAYRRAFEAGDGAQLVIKTVNGATSPVAFARLRAATADRHDITILDGYATPKRQQALMNACDAYVSLHRAEGYGLTMAEAMVRGKPVVATGYSGNLEFMTEETSVLVPYDLVPIPLGAGPYPPGSPWAEPDVESAAVALRRLADDRAWAAELGARAREHLATHHTPAARADWLRGRVVESLA